MILRVTRFDNFLERLLHRSVPHSVCAGHYVVLVARKSSSIDELGLEILNPLLVYRTTENGAVFAGNQFEIYRKPSHYFKQILTD